jgi:hypothetical protein
VASWRVKRARSALPGGLLLGDLGDRDRQQLLLAQQLADVPRGIAFEDPLALLAGGIERYVFERAHS